MRRLAAVMTTLSVFLVLAPSTHAQSGYEDAYERQLRGAMRGRTTADATPEKDVSRLGVGASLPGPVDPDAYIVGPGDIFELNLGGGVTEAIPLVVGPEGTTYVPGWGLLHLAGLTLNQARAEADRLFARGLRGGGVHWEFRLRSVRQMRVYLTGDLHETGPADVPATSRVADVIREDAMLDRASRRNLRITHRDGTTGLADLRLFQRTGRSDLNPTLRDGDVVHVPTAVDFVEIHGAVARPGRFELGWHDSLSTLFDIAGGPLPATLLDNALLVRWKTVTEPDSIFFSIDDVYREAFNPRLSEGDRIYVYFLPAYHELYQATILGEVMRPGTYPIDLGRTRLSDIVRSSEGFRPRADLTTIRLFRGNSLRDEDDPELQRLSRLSRTEMTNAEYEILRTRLAARREDHRVDWARLQSNSELDLLLAHGDIVRVDPIIASVRVEGEVRRPGLVDFDARFALKDYVALAGGFSKRADRGKMLVTRAVSGQTLPVKDVPTLSPGDMIWVPTRPDRTAWDHLQTLIAVSAQVATVVIAVRAARNF